MGEPALPADGSLVVPDGSYFVLGDNTGNAYDSRYWGPLPQRSLVGRVVWIIFPPSRAGRVK